MGLSIYDSLKNLFSEKRIVFWHDNKKEMYEEFLEIKLEKVEKIEIKNNEFSIKHKILKEKPDQKFLVYKSEFEETDSKDNWLLDIEKYSKIFNADKIKIWMNEFDFEPYFIDHIKKHRIFFNSERRKKILKEKLKKEDDTSILKKKMLLVISESEEDIEGLVGTLFDECFFNEDSKLKLIKRCGLEEFMWKLFENEYNYKKEKPNIDDFALELFKSCFEISINKNGTLNKNAFLLFQRWKNNRNNYEVFEGLSNKFQEVLNIKENINSLNYKDLLDFDFFKEIDCFIIKSLINEIKDKTIPNDKVTKILKQRRKTYWFKNFQDIYNALLYASEFLFEISNAFLEIDGFEKYIENYSSKLFKIDQLYRKFIFYYQKSSQPSLLGDINNLIENKYVNEFLLIINNNFQKDIDKLEKWEISNFYSQRSFYKKYIKDLRDKDKKCVVIISDALRFEIGDELNRKIDSLDRLNSKISPLISSLPSYTQIGMASLLPFGELGIPSPDNPNVMHNSNPTVGISNRRKILNKEISYEKPYVTKVSDFLDLKSLECKETLKDHNVIYLFHDRIDATGDSKKTEGNVFEAVEDSIEELIKLVKKITASGSANIVISSDHGFIYQHREIDASDYLSARPEAEEIYHNDRRFIIGKNFKESQSFKKFTSKELNIKGDFEVIFPKSINRLRKSGSGSRFVHGGISLQEILVPVICVTKSRVKDSTAVGVSILSGVSKNITTSQMSIKLYQESPIDNKNISRTLLIGLFSKDKKLISNQVEIVFDSNSENTRDREQIIKLTLTKSADEYNNQEVSLNLDEKYKNTSHVQNYKSMKFIIKRTFTNDFDF